MLKLISTWTQSTKLTASDGSDSDHFGCAVSISNDVAMVGAYFADAYGADSGSVYVFNCTDNTTPTIVETRETGCDAVSAVIETVADQGTTEDETVDSASSTADSSSSSGSGVGGGGCFISHTVAPW